MNRVPENVINAVREVLCLDALKELNVEYKVDKTFVPTSTDSKRIFVYGDKYTGELIITENRWFFSHALKKGGYGAIDLAYLVTKLGFREIILSLSTSAGVNLGASASLHFNDQPRVDWRAISYTFEELTGNSAPDVPLTQLSLASTVQDTERSVAVEVPDSVTAPLIYISATQEAGCINQKAVGFACSSLEHVSPAEDDWVGDVNGLTEASNYHRSTSSGYFSILSGLNTLRQTSYRLELLPLVIPDLNQHVDTYLSQGEFYCQRRRLVNLLRIGVHFVDIDVRNGNGPLTLNIERDMDFFFEWHHEHGGPFPSAIISSGRGYHLKWFLENPVPNQALPRWNAVQRALVEKYKELGADPAARDASRVLRVIGTTNTKVGKLTTMVYPRKEIEAERYSFEYMATEILPYSREDIATWRAARAEKMAAREAKLATRAMNKENSSISNNLRVASINWGRLSDLRKLRNIRCMFNGGSIPEGKRMLHLFWEINFLMLSNIATPNLMYAEAAELSRKIDPRWNYGSAELSTVYGKAIEYKNGKEVEYRGKLYPALYTPKSQHLIDIFEITPDEMTSLQTIITPEEAKRRELNRDEERRRAKGQKPREVYLEEVRVPEEVQIQAHRERMEEYRREAGQKPREDYLEEVKVPEEVQIQAQRERKEAYRREAGQKPREDYLEEAETRKSQARDLWKKGLSYRAIAMEMGVSVSSVCNYLKS
jgi:hypothetical protein